MAEFNVIFQRGTLPPPEYDNYSKDENVTCGEDIIDRNVTFQGTGDFRVGINFTSNYPPEKTLIIQEFNDVSTYKEISQNGPELPDSNVTPSQLLYNGSVVSLPFSLLINDIGNISFGHTSGEMECTRGSKYAHKRVRTIVYYIGDSNNQYGELKESVLTTNGI